MSAMVIASSEGLTGLSKRLERIGITSIHYYNSRSDCADAPMLALVPFVDIVIVGDDAGDAPRLDAVLSEAKVRKVPVISEDGICPRVQFP